MKPPAMINFSRQALAAECRFWGASVGPLPSGMDGAQLLWAISGVESSFGENCQPRHEPAFDVGGLYASHAPMPALLGHFGSAAACSYGPLQIMFCNAPLTYSPTSFNSLRLAMQPTVQFLNSLLRHWKPANLAEIGECWNAGHPCADLGYVAKLAATWTVAMPPAA